MSIFNPLASAGGRIRRLTRSLAAAMVLLSLVAAGCASPRSGQSQATMASDGAGGAALVAPSAPLEVRVAPDDATARVVDDAVEGERDQQRGPADVAEAEKGQTTATSSQPPTQAPDLGRDIIYTATIELASSDVAAATRDAIGTIERRGGFLFAQDSSGGAGGTSVLTFKIFPDQFQAALSDLGDVGSVRSQSISADDVTAVVVDLESRINTAEASVIRLRGLLDDASELETIATLENQLLQRETTLEQLRGQHRMVQDQVDMATITVTVVELLNQPRLALDLMTYADHDGGLSCFDGPSNQSVNAGDPMTVCYRLTNTGDTPLVDVTIEDPVLGATVDAALAVDGNATRLEVGESATIAYEFDLAESTRLDTSASAVGLDENGDRLDAEIRATAPRIRLTAVVLDDDFPSFGRVLGTSWDTLTTVALVLALAAVAVAPFVVVGLLIGMPAWMLFRRTRGTASSPAAPSGSPSPPPHDDGGRSTQSAEETASL